MLNLKWWSQGSYNEYGIEFLLVNVKTNVMPICIVHVSKMEVQNML